jgi:hypothetical protein
MRLMAKYGISNLDIESWICIVRNMAFGESKSLLIFEGIYDTI